MAVLLLVLLSAASWARNNIWKDEVILWDDSARKSFTDGRPFTNKAAELNRLGRYEEAVVEYIKALNRTPLDYFAHGGLAFAYYNIGRFDDAVAEYRKAIDLSGHPLYRKNLALALERKGDIRGALGEIEGLLKESPMDISLRDYFVMLLEKTGMREQHLLGLLQTYQSSRNPMEIFEAGWACVSLERNEEAAVYLRRALSGMHHFPAAQYYLGIALGRLGKIDDAIIMIEKAIKDPLVFQSAESHFNLGSLLQLKEDNFSAEKEYLLTLDIEPTHSHAHNNLGILYLSRGDRVGAIAEFQAAVAADPSNAEARKNLSLISRPQSGKGR